MAACIGSLESSAFITSSCAIFQSKGMAGVVGSEFEPAVVKKLTQFNVNYTEN